MKRIQLKFSAIILTLAMAASAVADGDDFQKPKLIDCQAVLVEAVQPVHNAKTFRACFYSVTIGKKGEEQRLILVIGEGLKPYYLAP